MKTYPRLDDTSALTRQGIRPAELCTADEPPKPAYGSADRAVAGPRPGQFQRETGAGAESLAGALKVLKEEC